MNNKRLHVHSAPLILFGLAATVMAIVSVNAWRLSPVTQALVQPAWRIETTSHGYVKVTTDKQLPAEKPGVDIELPQHDGGSVMPASQAVDSIGLQLVL